MTIKTNSTYYAESAELLDAVDNVVIETEVVLDLGCGIAPFNYFRPKLHIMVEPWGEYAAILAYRYQDDKSVLILKAGATDALAQFRDNAVDSIFLLDVIEHLEKDEGVNLIGEMERVARRQVVVFTPLGFMPQHVEAGEKDAWGLSGAEMQEHRSGWSPDDFPGDWSFYVCETYHKADFRGQSLEKPYGAFFAIRTYDRKSSSVPSALSDIRRPLPSELALEKLNAEHLSIKLDLANTKAQLEAAQSELARIRKTAAYMIYHKWTEFIGMIKTTIYSKRT